MRSASRFTLKPPGPELPPLVPGERMKQPEFHRRYEAYPEDVKFELIGGIVYMASPLRRSHGLYHPVLNGVLWLYMNATPGVEVLDNATTILGEESEPQPDLELRILSQYGGRSRETPEDYVQGPPELMVEVSHSTKVLDLRHKRRDYEKAGVLEYMVLSVEEQELYWWHFPSGGTIKPDRRGILRSREFPGLWIHRRALLARDTKKLIDVVQQGLASRAHAAFVKRLEAAHIKASMASGEA
jgi:Uma2 family endonuclease